MIAGLRVGLRAIEQDDLEPMRVWRNRPDFRRYFREHREISRPMQTAWFQEVVLGDPRVRMFAIEDLETGMLLGACGLCYIDWINRNADFSIYIGSGHVYIDDVFAPEAGRLLLRYGFEELGLHRIWAEIYAIDAPKQAFLPSLGFRLEGRHLESHFTEGAWTDSLFYGLLAREFSPQ